jgi:probable F420-dependent oxidoreductase
LFCVYATMDQRMPLSRVADHARRAEALGYDGLNVPEAVHDGLLAAGAALAATTRLRVATSVIVAFPRSPMAVAHAAWDLQELSGGRFELGLGSQVRGNIIGRYSTAWAPPVPRMREYVGSLRAIFDTWQNGTELRFEGEHYRFTRMQPFFAPGKLAQPEIPILLGGIGPGMNALAGEVADALVTHPTSSAPRYLREVVLPRLAKGAARAGRERSACRLVVAPLVASGESAEELRQAREGVRRLFGFLFSTPPYWPPLELFGWKERGEKLNELSRAGRWDAMTEIVSDEMLDAFSPCARYGEIAPVLREWYGDLTDSITFPMPEDPARDSAAAGALRALRGA